QQPDLLGAQLDRVQRLRPAFHRPVQDRGQDFLLRPDVVRGLSGRVLVAGPRLGAHQVTPMPSPRRAARVAYQRPRQAQQYRRLASPVMVLFSIQPPPGAISLRADSRSRSTWNHRHHSARLTQAFRAFSPPVTGRPRARGARTPARRPSRRGTGPSAPPPASRWPPTPPRRTRPGRPASPTTAGCPRPG